MSAPSCASRIWLPTVQSAAFPNLQHLRVPSLLADLRTHTRGVLIADPTKGSCPSHSFPLHERTPTAAPPQVSHLPTACVRGEVCARGFRPLSVGGLQRPPLTSGRPLYFQLPPSCGGLWAQTLWPQVSPTASSSRPSQPREVPPRSLAPASPARSGWQGGNQRATRGALGGGLGKPRGGAFVWLGCRPRGQDPQVLSAGPEHEPGRHLTALHLGLPSEHRTYKFCPQDPASALARRTHLRGPSGAALSSGISSSPSSTGPGQEAAWPRRLGGSGEGPVGGSAAPHPTPLPRLSSGSL